MNRFTLHFTAFVGSASAMALVLVAVISFACQSARVGQGGDKGREMWNSTASRPQDGLSQAVDTPRPTGGKPVDLRRATREVAAGSPAGVRIEPSEPPTLRALVNRHTQAPRLVGLVNAGRDIGAMRPCHPSVTDRRDGRFAHSSSVSMGESGLSLPAHLRSTMVREPGPSEQGVRSVPGRFGRDARGHSSAGPASMRSDRSAHTATKPSKDNSAVSRGRLESLATSAARLCGVPVRLFHSLIARESSWNPRARSSSGALGLGQLMPAAAKEMGVEDRLDPWQNALGAACFLRKQYDRAGSWRKALLSYHGGPNRVRTSQASHDYAQDIIEGSAN